MILNPQLLTGRVILCVDDDVEICAFADEALRTYGASPVTATSARQALSMMDRHMPNVLLADISMPGEDGYWLIEELQRRGKRVPAVAITGFADRYSRLHAMARGFDDYLTKPFGADDLCATVMKVLGRGLL